MTTIEEAAAELGRKGGKSTSQAKQEAAKANGQKGGRPKKMLTVEDVTEKEARRILSNISISPVTGCWNWTAALSQDGYGVTTFRTKYIPAHRFMFAWFNGPIPSGQKQPGSLELDHIVCSNRACVNPFHLALVPTQANVLRGDGPTAHNSKKTHCKNGHLLPVEPNTPTGRRCLECMRIRARKYARDHAAERAAYAEANRDNINARRRANRKTKHGQPPSVDPA